MNREHLRWIIDIFILSLLAIFPHLIPEHSAVTDEGYINSATGSVVLKIRNLR